MKKNKYKQGQVLYYLTIDSPFKVLPKKVIDRFVVKSWHNHLKTIRYIGDTTLWPKEQWTLEEDLFETRKEAGKHFNDMIVQWKKGKNNG